MFLDKFKANTINVYASKTKEESVQKLNDILIKLIKEHAGGGEHGKEQ